MLLAIRDYMDVDPEQCLAVYQETVESTSRCMANRSFYPLMFLAALSHILAEGTQFMVWVDKDIWRSALLLRQCQDHHFTIDSLETHPAYRDQGYAAALLQAVIQHLRQTGPFVLEDWVEEGNLPSLQAHEKAGFIRCREIGDSPHYESADSQCCSMRYVYPGPNFDLPS